MSVAAGRPPNLSNQELSLLIVKHFNFKTVSEDSIKSFPSYRDRTYYFKGESVDETECEFILKMSNPLSTPLEVIEGVNEVMKHLSAHGLLSPNPLATRKGKELVQLTSEEMRFQTSNNISSDASQMKYCVCVLTFIPGKIFDHVEKYFLTPSLLHQVGEQLGKMDKELMEKFSCKALASRKNTDWDLMLFLDMKSYVQDIDDPLQRSNAEKIFKAFEEHVKPKIPSFKQGVIHGDLNGLNIVIRDSLPTDERFHLAGLIDFNDCVKTCCIFELGISLAYIMQENMHPVHCSSSVEFVGPLISAYNTIFPLTAEELDSLYYLVLARCCQTALNGMRSFKVEPWNTYLLTTPQKSWILVDELLKTPKEQVDKIWKNYINV